MVLCVVTGATGFVGVRLCQRLRNDGHEVRAFCRNPSDTLKQLMVDIVLGDVTDVSAVRSAVEGAEVVFHLAAFISYKPSDRSAMFAVNVEGTRNVAEACASQECRLVHVSSMGAIGASPDRRVLTEEWRYNLSQHQLSYCESKRDAEAVVKALVDDSNLDVVIVNPCHVYGSGDALKASRKTHVSVALGNFPFYTKGGVNVVHVDDVVEGMILAWKRGRKGERYIIGGENITVKHLFEVIADKTGVRRPFLYMPLGIQLLLGKIGILSPEKIIPANMNMWFTSDKASSQLGYRASWSAADAIRDSVDFMQRNLPQFKKKQTSMIKASSASAWAIGVGFVLLLALLQYLL